MSEHTITTTPDAAPLTRRAARELENGRGRRSRRRRGAGRSAALAVVPLALLGSGALVYQASNAAFTATTATGTNTWTAGTVTLTNSGTGLVVFNLTGLKPGDTGTKCVKVTYTGNLAASGVKLYVPSLTNNAGLGAAGLGTYLDLVITEGTGGSPTALNSHDCTGFVAGSTLTSSDTLATFQAAHDDYSTGVSSWAPAASSNDTRTYRITYTLQDDNAAQGKNVQAVFQWEAQS